MNLAEKQNIVGCVIANGEFEPCDNSKKHIQSCDVIIAANGGLRFLTAMNLNPNIWIGDMDSSEKDCCDTIQGIEKIVYPQDKNETDTELAVDNAIMRGCTRVDIYGGYGKRLDHMLGNILLAVKYPGIVRLITKEGYLLAMEGLSRYVISGKPGAIVSLIPFDTLVQNIRTKGLHYCLDGRHLRPGTHGMSNYMESDTASVEIQKGCLLIYVGVGEQG